MASGNSTSRVSSLSDGFGPISQGSMGTPRMSKHALSLEKARKMLGLQNEADENSYAKAVHVFRLRNQVTLRKEMLQQSREEPPLQIKYPRTLLRPDTSFLRLWNLMILTMAFYQFYMLLYRLSFMSQLYLTIFDLLVDGCFMLDVIFQFNTMLFDPFDDSDYISDRVEIAIAYIRSWFIVDLIGAIPFDLLLVEVEHREAEFTSEGSNDLSVLRSFRLRRLLRVFILLRTIRLMKINEQFKRWIQYSRYSNILRLFRLILMLFSLTHLLACFWYSQVAGFNWKATNDSVSNYLHGYWKSYYTCLLLLTSGQVHPETAREKLFCNVVLLLGAVVMAIVFGNVAVLIANFEAQNSSLQEKMEKLYDQMQLMKLPTDVRQRVNQYYHIVWEKYNSLDGSPGQVNAELGTNLDAELLLYYRMDMVFRVPFFKKCSSEAVRAIVLTLKLQLHMPNDYIVVTEEVGRKMYFIQSGKCLVTTSSYRSDFSKVSEDEVVIENAQFEQRVKTLSQGDYFGEIGLLIDAKRGTNVRSLTFVEICVLSRDEFHRAIDRYASDRKYVETQLMKTCGGLKHAYRNLIDTNDAAREGFDNEEDYVIANQERTISLLTTIASQLQDKAKVQKTSLHTHILPARSLKIQPPVTATTPRRPKSRLSSFSDLTRSIAHDMSSTRETQRMSQQLDRLSTRLYDNLSARSGRKDN